LVVLVKKNGNSTSARAANLSIPGVEAPTVRAALHTLVQNAKKVIEVQLASGNEVPWIQPSEPATEAESRFMVPLHL
jgi:hypothetical protein